MATLSPSPNSSPSAVPPTSTSPPPQLSNLSPPPKSSPSTQPNDDPPESSTPPPLPPPPPPSASQPANSVTPPPAKPPAVASATPNPPSAPPPAPTTSSPPPPPVTITPPPSINASPPPPPKSDPPVSSPPPTRPPSPSSSVNTTTSPPPAPSITPTTISPPPPPPPSSPPVTAPTPPSSTPPKSSPPPPPPPSSEPPASSPPPPPPSEPPASSNPPPASKPPESSPPPPVSSPPKKSPSPPDAKPPSTAPSPPSGSPPPSDLPAASPPPVASETPAPLDPVSPSVSLSPPQTPVPSTGSAARNGSSSPYVPQTTKSSGNGGLGTSGVVAIGVIVGVVMLGLVGIAAWWVWKRKKRTSGPHGGYILPSSLGSSPRSDIKLMVTEYKAPLAGGGYGSDSPTDRGGLGHSRSWFTYQELVEATDGFSEENLLGEGGFGCVYKGCLVDGREVAVKQLKIGGGQGEREFKAEVEIISRIHHRHLVSLVGYCIFESRRLLVYEYFPNDTLHFHLHGKDRPVMDWAKRVKIAAGAARGMAYLHEDCHPRIIHRDIKSSNILLDNNFEARVSDFGLAKLALDAETHVSTRVMGTFGYLAPEYATTGKLTEKSDVYSFGVVLLELITGRRPVDESQPVGDESLVEWARPLLSHALETGEVGGLVDPRLEKNYVESEMYRMVEAAAACVRYSAGKRPRMGQVVRALDGISNSDDLSNGMRVGESQMYNSAQSEEIRLFRRMAFGSQNYSTDFFTQASYSAGFPTRARQNAELSTQHSQSVNHSSHHSQRDDHLSPDGENAGFSSHRSLNR